MVELADAVTDELAPVGEPVPDMVVEFIFEDRLKVSALDAVIIPLVLSIMEDEEAPVPEVGLIEVVEELVKVYDGFKLGMDEEDADDAVPEVGFIETAEEFVNVYDGRRLGIIVEPVPVIE